MLCTLSISDSQRKEFNPSLGGHIHAIGIVLFFQGFPKYLSHFSVIRRNNFEINTRCIFCGSPRVLFHPLQDEDSVVSRADNTNKDYQWN